MENKEMTIIKYYGVRNQLKKLSKECYELQEAILDYENNIDYDRNHIKEEIADVLVLISQFASYYRIDEDTITKIGKEKINRQLNRIKSE